MRSTKFPGQPQKLLCESSSLSYSYHKQRKKNWSSTKDNYYSFKKRLNRSGLKPRLHEKFLCDKYLIASKRSFYKSTFYLKAKDWTLGSMDHSKNIFNFMCCLVYTDNILYVTIFVCHIKTNKPVFQQI